jgi:hypothetical protein
MKNRELIMRKMMRVLFKCAALVMCAAALPNLQAVAAEGSTASAGLSASLHRFGVPWTEGEAASDAELPAVYRQLLERLRAVPQPDRPPLQACFYPGTDPKIVERVTQLLYMPSSNPADYYLRNRWTTTAHGSTGVEGNPIVLTYSFVPDGVNIAGGAGEAASANRLNATMTSLFGSPNVWKPLFAQCFARWSELSGITYQEVSDDGAAFTSSAGVIGSRGDIRIAAHPIDGAYGILAFNYYPNSGDMVLDSDEPWNETGGDNIFLRNVVMHEHGHGIGINHVCPIVATKLLEPYYSPDFDGPQHDDIRAAQKYYGDRFEHNESAATATNLGNPPDGSYTVDNVGTDKAADIDVYKITLPAGKRLTATLSPVGAGYYSDAQNANGSCPTPATLLNTVDDQNLEIRLIAPDGLTVLYNANSQSAGVAESIPPTDLIAAGTYYLRVANTSANAVIQLYTLSYSIGNVPPPPAPTGLVLTTDSANTVGILAWNPVSQSGITYQIFADSLVSGPFLTSLGTVSDTFFIDTIATAAERRFYWVKALR